MHKNCSFAIRTTAQQRQFPPFAIPQAPNSQAVGYHPIKEIEVLWIQVSLFWQKFPKACYSISSRGVYH